MARQSPRKMSASTTIGVPVEKPGRRCRICEGRPLKAICACTLHPDGTRRIKQRARKSKELAESTAIPGPILPLPVTPPQTWSLLGLPSTDGQTQVMPTEGGPPIHTSTIPAPLVLCDQSQNIDPFLATSVDDLDFGLAPATIPPASPIPDGAIMNNQYKAVHLLTTGSLITMPDLSTNFSGDLTSGRGTNELISEDNSSSSDDEDALSSTPCRPTGLQAFKGLSSPEYQAARRAWVPALHRRAPKKKKAALYGVVGGSMQGSLPLKIRRRKALRSLITDCTAAGRRFTREMKFVIDRAERVALETGSWVFIAGQQPQSRTNFIHFSSNEMRTIALEDTQRLTNHFSQIISDLREARTGNALATQRTLRETQTAFETFQVQVQKTLEVKDQQTEYLKGMVEALHQQMGIPAGALDLCSLVNSNEPVASGSKSM